MHQRGQDVPAGCLYCNTLYPDHRPALINLRHSSHTLCPQSGQVATCQQTPTHPPTPHSHTIPAGPALSCPLGSGAWLHNMRIRRRGHKGELIFVTKARSHFRTHKVSEDHRGWARNIWFNKLYHNLHASSVTRSDF